jgi:hypothetical protein
LAAGNGKNSDDSSEDEDLMTVDEPEAKIKKDPMTDYVENVFKKFQDQIMYYSIMKKKDEEIKKISEEKGDASKNKKLKKE